MKKNLRNERESFERFKVNSERGNFVRFKVKSEKEKLILENIKTLLRISGKSITDGMVLEKIDDDNWTLSIGAEGDRIHGVIVGDDRDLGDYIRLILETPKDTSVVIPICKKVRNIFEYLSELSRCKDISIIHICIDKNENFGKDCEEEEEKEYRVKIVGNKFTFDFDFNKGDSTDFGLNEQFIFRMF